MQKALHAEAISGQFSFEFLNALFNRRPLIVVAPKEQCVLVAIGDKDAEGIAGDIRELAAYGWFGFPNPFAHDDESAGFLPAKELHGEFAHGIAFVDLRPLADRCRPCFDVGGELRDDHVGKFPVFEKLAHATASAGVTATQLTMKDTRSLGKHSKERVVALATGSTRIVPLCRAFLLAGALENRRIQIEAESFGRRSKHRDHLAPELAPEGRDGSLGESREKIANGVGARKPGYAEHGVKGLIRTKPVCVGESARSGDDRAKKRHEGLRGRDRIWTAQIEGHRLLELPCKADSTKKLDQAYQSTERRHRLRSTA